MNYHLKLSAVSLTDTLHCESILTDSYFPNLEGRDQNRPGFDLAGDSITYSNLSNSVFGSNLSKSEPAQKRPGSLSGFEKPIMVRQI